MGVESLGFVNAADSCKSSASAATNRWFAADLPGDARTPHIAADFAAQLPATLV